MSEQQEVPEEERPQKTEDLRMEDNSGCRLWAGALSILLLLAGIGAVVVIF